MLDATASISDVHFQLPDSIHFLDLQKVELKTYSKELTVDTIRYYPIGDRFNPNKRLTLNEFFIPRFNLYGLGISSLLLHKNLEGDLLNIENPDFKIIMHCTIREKFSAHIIKMIAGLQIMPIFVQSYNFV